jgi:hypothetical protein
MSGSSSGLRAKKDEKAPLCLRGREDRIRCRSRRELLSWAGFRRKERIGGKPLTSTLHIDGRPYKVEVIRRVSLPPDAPRLIVVSRQVNEASTDLVRVCIETIQHFTPEPHELWVVDNNSPRQSLAWLLEWPAINVALNRTEPRPPEARTTEDEGSLDVQLTWDSYSNAIALEVAVRLISSDSQYVMTLHMDTMPCRRGWLSYLRSRITDRIRAAGVRMDRTRSPEGILHVLGYLVDFQLFKRLQLDFLPDLPALDVGDKVTRRLREVGYEVFACPNTLWSPELAAQIPVDSPLREFRVDRAFDDEGHVIFLHLGRGVRKSIGLHQRGTMAEEWIRVARESLLV